MLNSNVQFLRGIGQKRADILRSEVGIETIEDLLYFAPRKYIDRSAFKAIKDSFVNETVTIAGTIKSVRVLGRNRKFLEVEITDDTDSLCGIFFQGLQYLRGIFNLGDYVLFSGRIDFYRKKQIVHPDFDFIDIDSQIQSIHTGRIVPLYRSTQKLKRYGLDSKGFRRIIRDAIDSHLFYIEDPLDASLLLRLQLNPLQEAIFSLHFPDSMEKAEQARKRLSYNELFFLQYYLAISRKYSREELRIIKNNIDTSLFNKLISSLPFELTVDQVKAIEEIKRDIENPYPMNRLLQGDVGCGKTVVAMAASMLVIGRDEQVAFMAPTELLANQHLDIFEKLLPSDVKISLLTGAIPKSEKGELYSSISNGETDIVIGTHAIIQEGVTFHNLGLIIIDEQHRFGVNQRAKLRGKGEHTDLIIMTATPIPRSLSLTLYGDLDVTYIKEKPKNRLAIKTLSLPESRLGGVYASVEKYINQGRQAYFVLPLIEESEKVDIKSAIEVYEHLKENIFPHRRIEILHGRMSPEERGVIMHCFKDGEIDILVATTVIEVGIDVPNANIIVIEHAERFGLSTLHQLRGRVGRGIHQSFCVLTYPDNISQVSKKRINSIASMDDGFKIAEEDLKIRGSGEIIGIRQHGHSIGFEFSDLHRDVDLILSAKREAERVVSEIEDVHTLLIKLEDNLQFSPIMKGIRTKRILSILS
ncbi:MAG: ATP-dependent DNA helicase RecG [Spirochaetota bacterium]|nr:ATP-dependent DNA helicase RecG [Spirochaetota bacterium]